MSKQNALWSEEWYSGTLHGLYAPGLMVIIKSWLVNKTVEKFYNTDKQFSESLINAVEEASEEEIESAIQEINWRINVVPGITEYNPLISAFKQSFWLCMFEPEVVQIDTQYVERYVQNRGYTILNSNLIGGIIDLYTESLLIEIKCVLWKGTSEDYQELSFQRIELSELKHPFEPWEMLQAQVEEAIESSL